METIVFRVHKSILTTFCVLLLGSLLDVGCSAGPSISTANTTSIANIGTVSESTSVPVKTNSDMTKSVSVSAVTPTTVSSNLSSLRGSINDYRTGRPIASVTIFMGERMACSDPSGIYEFDEIEPGQTYLLGSIWNNQRTPFARIELQRGENRLNVQYDVVTNRIVDCSGTVLVPKVPVSENNTGQGISTPLPQYSDTGILLKNPSWQEMLDFLWADDTDSHQYVSPQFQQFFTPFEPPPLFLCGDFAVMLQEHAKVAGWRCAIVTATLGGQAHALNAFQTTDRGLVYIDDTRAEDPSLVTAGGPPNQDKVVDPKSGQETFLFPQGWTILPMKIVIDKESLLW